MEEKTIFDNKVFKDVLNYLDNATPEQLEEDLKQIEKLNKYGPLMGDLIKGALNKNKEQDKFKFPEMHPLYVIPNYSHYSYNPNIHIIPDGYGGFKIKPDYEVTTTTTSTTSLKTKIEQ